MNIRSLLIITLSLLLLFSAVGAASAQGPTDDFAVVQAAADKYLSSGKSPTIAADAVWENLNDGDASNDPFILSVRKPEDYAKGHLPGAVNILWKDVAKMENLAKLPADRPIVAYCYTGHTGEVATTVLGVLGYDVSNLKYGMMGWSLDDAVVATARFGPDTDQRDYRIETTAVPAAEQPAPAELPTTGAPASPAWLLWLAAGCATLVAGLILRRRLTN
jgi:LPXTG-motif cell wall-anchored protein